MDPVRNNGVHLLSNNFIRNNNDRISYGMDIKELNKSQLILLAILLSFITSIATGIVTVTLMQQAPASITTPITQVVKQTVEKIVPASLVPNNTPVLSDEQKALLEQLKAIKPLTVSLFLKGENSDKDKVLGTGLFLGDNKVVIASLINPPKEGENYVVKSILGEQKVSKVTQENDFTIIELVDADASTTSVTTSVSSTISPKRCQTKPMSCAISFMRGAPPWVLRCP